MGINGIFTYMKWLIFMVNGGKDTKSHGLFGYAYAATL